MNFKEIHIGSYIENKVKEDNISIDRIVSFFKKDESEILQMYTFSDLSSDLLLRWSKLLEYDLFRIYSHHLLLYSPPKGTQYVRKNSSKKSELPEFRKSIYTKELIEFIIEQLQNGEKTKQEIIRDYRIPKTTLYKWITKHSKDS
ncbi:transposase [Empedobacter brevis]|uniref:transposase n=1 Tax=Empedobacter brevis TaxID=247 RepID=UPI0028A2D65F|nr:transposase [Empedobacter brevis]